MNSGPAISKPDKSFSLSTLSSAGSELKSKSRKVFPVSQIELSSTNYKENIKPPDLTNGMIRIMQFRQVVSKVIQNQRRSAEHRKRVGTLPANIQGLSTRSVSLKNCLVSFLLRKKPIKISPQSDGTPVESKRANNIIPLVDYITAFRQAKKLNPTRTPQEVLKRVRLVFIAARIVHRLKKINKDVLLYGTSSNLFDLTTRDRDRVKQTIYPRIYDITEPHIIDSEHLLKFMPHPRHKFIQIWSITIFLLLLYCASALPYLLVFVKYDGKDWKATSWVIYGFFWLDMLINLISAYYNEEYKLITNRKRIALNYLKTWFAVDLLAVFPFYAISESLSTQEEFNSDVMLELTRGPQLYMLLKILKIGRVVNSLKDGVLHWYFESCARTINIMTFFLSLVLLVHNAGCVWYLIAKTDNPNADTWVARLKEDGESMDNYEAYFASIYYIFSTLTTVGYGDIVPVTLKEKMFTIVWMIFAVGFYSFTIGLLTSTFSNRDTRGSNLKRKVTLVNEFVKEVKAPKRLKEKIKKVLEYNSLKNCFSWADKKNLFSEIPINLRYEAVMHMHNGVLSQIPFLKENVDKYFVVTIATHLKPIEIKAHERLWTPKSSPESLYFLTSGRVNFIEDIYLREEGVKKSNPVSIVFKRIIAGSYFGETDIIFRRQRLYTVQAAADCELFYLTKHDFDVVIVRGFPHIAAEMKDIAFERDRRNQQSIKELKKFLIQHMENKNDNDSRKAGVVREKERSVSFFQAPIARTTQQIELSAEEDKEDKLVILKDDTADKNTIKEVDIEKESMETVPARRGASSVGKGVERTTSPLLKKKKPSLKLNVSSNPNLDTIKNSTSGSDQSDGSSSQSSASQASFSSHSSISPKTKFYNTKMTRTQSRHKTMGTSLILNEEIIAAKRLRKSSVEKSLLKIAVGIDESDSDSDDIDHSIDKHISRQSISYRKQASGGEAATSSQLNQLSDQVLKSKERTQVLENKLTRLSDRLSACAERISNT